MARPRSFDEETVLDGAMQAFRASGFAGTSVSSLERATGLATSSLYNAFGGKSALHDRVLAHYAASIVRPRLERFAGPQARLEDLHGLFASLFEPPLNDGLGCLVINTATELGPHPAAASVLEDVRRHIAAVLTRELGTAEDAEELTLLYQGLLVQIRAGAVSAAFRAAVDRAIERLVARRDRAVSPPEKEIP